MTGAEFVKRYGPEWRKFQATPLYAALVDTVRESNPRAELPDRPSGDIVVAGNILCAEIRGYERLFRLFHVTLAKEEPPPEEPSDYSQDLDEQLSANAS